MSNDPAVLVRQETREAAERLAAWAQRCRTWEALFRGLSQDPLILTKHPYDKDDGGTTKEAQDNARLVADQERQQAEDLERAVIALEWMAN